MAEEIRSRIIDATTLSVEEQGNVKFGLWVSFMEIYNELIYDLLDLTPIGKGRKRPALKLGDDKNGKPYVKGMQNFLYFIVLDSCMNLLPDIQVIELKRFSLLKL